jgi:hypothetical protein
MASATSLILTSSFSPTNDEYKPSEEEKGEKLTRKNDGLNVIIVAQHPDEQLGEITRVDELAERFSGPGYDERRTIF